MNVKEDSIEFIGLEEFADFVERNSLYGKIALLEPLMDHGENLLIKENIPLTAKLFRKLTEIEGHYEPIFPVRVTAPILRSLREQLATGICACTNNEFTRYLLAASGRDYLSLVRNSFESTSFILHAYRLMLTKPIHFAHLAGLGLMTLGISLIAGKAVRMVRRHAFLAGFCAELGGDGEHAWRYRPDGQEWGKEFYEASARKIEELEVPSGLNQVVRNQTSFGTQRLPDARDSIFSEFLDNDTEIQSDEEYAESDESSSAADRKPDEVVMEALADESLEVITEYLKLARFVFQGLEDNQDQHRDVQNIIAELAYNATRGFFHRDVALPILQCFRQFVREAEQVMRIAQLERKCVHKVSAWAYPKPNATQVLCSLNQGECPLRLSGFDIHVFEEQKPFGRIGQSMEPGVYNKCKLEYKLDALRKPEDTQEDSHQAG